MRLKVCNKIDLECILLLIGRYCYLNILNEIFRQKLCIFRYSPLRYKLKTSRRYSVRFEIFIPFSSFKNNSNISKHPQTIMLSNKALKKNVPQTLLRYVFASASLRYKRYSKILKILNQRKTPRRRLGLCPAKTLPKILFEKSNKKTRAN